MTSDLTSGVLTLAGTVVGGLITFSGTAWTARKERGQAQRARLDQVTDNRRQAWVVFLTRLDTFLDHTRELVVAMDGDVTGDALRDLHQRYEHEWLEFVASNAAVQIAGPKLVAERADALRRAAGAYSDVVDARYQDGRWGRDRDKAWEAVTTARNAFLEATQDDFAS